MKILENTLEPPNEEPQQIGQASSDAIRNIEGTHFFPWNIYKR